MPPCCCFVLGDCVCTYVEEGGERDGADERARAEGWAGVAGPEAGDAEKGAVGGRRGGGGGGTKHKREMQDVI